MAGYVGWIAAAVALAALAGCDPGYSPNTYSAAAVQQANKVDKGVVIGVRNVDVSAAAVLGTAAGGAAGGIVGAQTPGGVGSAFGALGGALVGGLVGSSVEHATTDTTAFEYIVRKPGGDLVSVTQKDAVPLAIGTNVLVIAGNQARIVRDYTQEATKTAAAPSSETPISPQPTEAAPPPPAVTATALAPPTSGPTPLTPPPASVP